jgi:hypothetical protein
MSRNSGIPRWLKKLLLTLSTLGAAAVTFVLMRREGDRLAGLRESSVERLKGRLSGNVVPRLGGRNPFARSTDRRRDSPPEPVSPVSPASHPPRPVRVADDDAPVAPTAPMAPMAEVATFPTKVEASGSADAEPRRCAGITGSGKRCSREVAEGEEYCWQHGPG